MKIIFRLASFMMCALSLSCGGGVITITTEPHTDLWQRTYYHFRNDNAPVLQMPTASVSVSMPAHPKILRSRHVSAI